jgi:ubiquinone/menaquinone biosynthesis C-methylase UbiE
MSQYQAKDRYQDQRVASTYDTERSASLYSRLYSRRELHALDLALRWIEPGSRVLDLACGTGRITQHLMASGVEVVGADISLPMMEMARDKLSETVALVGCDAEALPFPDAAFDWVVSVRLFGHLPPAVRARTLSEAARVARRGVIIAFYLLNSVTRVRRFVKSLARPDPHWHPESHGRMIRELAMSGLQVRQSCTVIPLIDQARILVATKWRRAACADRRPDARTSRR